jgi:hypothetical protein
MSVDARIMNRRDSEQNWNKENPTLLFGELAIVDSIDSTYMKVGNGFSRFKELPNLAVVSLSKIYPVGSVYLSVAHTNPANLFGFGTWIELQDGNKGRLPYGLPSIYAWHRIK